MVIPMFASAYISLTNWNLLKTPKFVGFTNFQNLFSDDLFYKSLGVTLEYTIKAVPANILLSVMIAILLNKNLKGMSAFRTSFYLPSIISGVVISLAWLWIFQPDYGLLNEIIGYFGIKPSKWIYDEASALNSLVLSIIVESGDQYCIVSSTLRGIPLNSMNQLLLMVRMQ